MKNSNSLKMNLIAAEREEYEDLTGVNQRQSNDGHYNTNAPPGHWRPQHRRAISYLALKVPAEEDIEGQTPEGEQQEVVRKDGSIKKINRKRLA